MTAVAVAAVAGEPEQPPAPPQEQQQQGFMDMLLQTLTYFFLFNILMNAGQWMARQTYAKNMVSSNATVMSSTTTTMPSSLPFVSQRWQQNHNLLWPRGSHMSLEVFLKEDTDCRQHSKNSNVLAHWMEEDIVFSPKNHDGNRRNATFNIPISQNMLNNKTRLFAHIYLKQLHHDSIEGSSTELYKCLNMTKFKTRKKDLKLERSLMEDPRLMNASSNLDAMLNLDPSDKSVLATAARNTMEDVTLMYIKPTLTLQLVEDTPESFKKSSIPTQISKHLDFLDLQDDNDFAADYYPIFYPSEFWMRHQDTFPVNGTLSNVSLTFYLQPVRMWKWQLMSQMEETWRVQEEQRSVGTGGADLIRTLLMDTNPWLLAVTAIVSLLHSAFDILAFKNDINFFKGKKSMEGLSLRSMIINTFFQIVIFLYLLDNSTDTSYMVIMSNAFGLLIEFWKISKAFTISFSNSKWITWEATGTYKNSKTKEYDEIATSHLLYVSMPLVGGYGIYSLFHQKHKGWYSWILNTMVGFIYMFGFVMMTPQVRDRDETCDLHTAISLQSIIVPDRFHF
jgi:hypothetical protein